MIYVLLIYSLQSESESIGVIGNSVTSRIVLYCWPTGIHNIQNMFRITSDKRFSGPSYTLFNKKFHISTITF